MGIFKKSLFVKGYCLDLYSNDYLCICSANYTGSNCETLVACNKCENNGTCMVDLETGGYSCICSLTFYGLNCELEVTCSQRCLNKGLSYLFIYFKNVKFYFLKEFAC